MKIKSITWGTSVSGNTGCNNGVYDVPVTIEWDNGRTFTEHTCACGNGCSNTFPCALLKVGMDFDDYYDLSLTHFPQFD